jgi:hypothetical protein
VDVPSARPTVRDAKRALDNAENRDALDDADDRNALDDSVGHVSESDGTKTDDP